MNDALELKGFAQVLNQPNSQLGLLANMKMRQDQLKYQRQAEGEKAFNDLMNGLYSAKVDARFEDARVGAFTISAQALQGLYEQGYRNGNFSSVRSAASKIKSDHDNLAHSLENVSNSVKGIEEEIRKNPEKYNSNAGVMLDNIVKGSLLNSNNQVAGDNDQITGLDYEHLAKLNNIFKDPSVYNKSYIFKTAIDRLKTSSVENPNDPFGSTMKTEYSNFWDVDKNGKIQYDPNTGRPKMKVNPESMNAILSEPGGEAKSIIEGTAKELATQNPNKYPRWEDAMMDAYKKEVGPYAGIKEELTTKQPSDRFYGAGELALKAKNRYWDRINPAIYGEGETQQRAVGSLLDPEKGYKAELVNRDNGAEAGAGGKVQPKEIQIYKWQLADSGPAPSLTGDSVQDGINALLHKSSKEYQWVPYEKIPIDTKQQQREALFKINAYNNDSGKDKELYDQHVKKEDDLYQKQLKETKLSSLNAENWGKTNKK